MDVLQNEYYRLSRFWLILVGQWPYDRSNVRHFKRLFVSFFGTSMAFAQILKLATSEFELYLFLEVFTPVAIAVLGVTKYCTCWIKADLVLERVKHDWSVITASEERKVLEKYAAEGKLVVLAYFVCIYSSVSVFVVLTFMQDAIIKLLPFNTTQSRRLPFVAEYLVDQEQYFYPILVHMDLTAVTALTMMAAADFFYVAVLFHACGVFGVLGHRLEHLFDDFEGKEARVCESKTEWLLFKRVARCVKFHEHVMGYVNLLNSIFVVSGLLQMCQTVFILSTLILRMVRSVQSIDHIDDMMVCTIHASGYIFLAFLSFHPCQVLLDTSEDVSFRTYSSLWYEMPSRVKKLLLLIMRKGMEPCGLAAGNMVTASIQVYATLVQTCMSYFTVLYSFMQ